MDAMRRAADLVTFTLAVAITATLGYFAHIAESIQLADISVQPAVRDRIRTLEVKAAGRVDHGAVPVLITGSIDDPTVSRLTLITTAPGSTAAPTQTDCCAVSKLAFIGTAQLGTPRSPVTRTPLVAFQLVPAGGNRIVASGTIAVHVESYPGGNQLANDIILGLSLFATVISLLRLRRPQNPAPQGG